MKKYFILLIAILCFSCSRITKKQTVKNDSIVTYSFNKIKVSNSKIEIQKLLKKSKNDIVFLGDSKTEGFPVQEMFENSNVKNRGIAGNTTKDVLDRLSNITSGKPHDIFIEIGVNDLSQNIPVIKVFYNFKNICEQIKKDSPSTEIFVQSVLPTTLEQKHLNANINKYNDLLKNYCQSNKLTYIDINHYFLLGDNMDKKYTIDGIHLNADGYKLWKELLTKYISKN